MGSSLWVWIPRPHTDSRINPLVSGISNVSVQINPKSLNTQWRRRTVSLGLMEVTLSLKFCPHPTGPPKFEAQPRPVFCVAIETVAQ